MVSALDYYIDDVTPFAVGGPYQVQLDYYYPNLNSPITYSGAGVATIGPSFEYPDAHYGYVSVNMKLRKMIITFLLQASFASVEYNGFMVTSLTSGAYLPQPAYFFSSTIDTGLMTLTSTPTTIYLNWAGMPFTPSDVIVIGW